MEKGFAQHYLECTLCEANAVFYCNTCQFDLCQTCKIRHQTKKPTKNHDVVLYSERRPASSPEPCIIHLDKMYDAYCPKCITPVCMKCVMEKHVGHELKDLRTAFQDKVEEIMEKMPACEENLIPRYKDMVRDLNDKKEKCTLEILKIKNILEFEAEEIKKLVDAILKEKKNNLDGIQKTLMEDFTQQETKINTYITQTQSFGRDFERWKETTEYASFLSMDLETRLAELKDAPKIKEMSFPNFKENKIKKNDIENMFSSVSLGKELNVPECMLLSRITKGFHLSYQKSGRIWMSDFYRTLLQTDLDGNILNTVDVKGGGVGFHTVSKEGDLLFTDQENGCLNKIKHDGSVERIFPIKNLVPICVHASKINGDILVGMTNTRENKVARYNKSNEEVQKIEKDDNGDVLFSSIFYITENFQGDICVSDNRKKTVVVVSKTGKHRFNYTGDPLGTLGHPWGICTDAHGHILVCDPNNKRIHKLDTDGRLLCYILTHVNFQEGAPVGICLDQNNDLWIGNWKNATIKRFGF
ncbi:E3 ubiquitin-protein ligase TRIM71-like [Saccostrea echinata]|uniref:E3 ubiquitin-protein ligase TRIM71-like n=1 Tax=Saccostrea echinata TaxID=191078 RepID=UPI002A800420|nr:E3 ubiquitin-protein ligase TRIM71-like [Saccostrea echinata]